MKKLKNDPEVRKLHRQTIKWHNDKFDKLTGIKKVNGKLKLFTPEADITYKMKKIVSVIKKVTLHLNILSLLIFFACGSDNPVNNGNPPLTPSNEILVMSLDSFNLSGIGFLNKDTIFNMVDTTYDSLKITFDVTSNCDTTNNAVLNVSFGHTGILLFHRDLNTSHTLYAAKSDSFYFALYSGFISTENRFIRASNFKLYLR